MTVPALNPSISTSERDTFGATTAPRRLAKLDLLLASEGGSEIYLSLLRDPNTEFVKELLRDGGTEFGIEEIGAEGRVELLSYSEMTCQTASGGSLVTGTIRNSADYYYELVLSNGEQFRVTAKHPIWVETKKDFVSAEKLSLGDQVRLYADTFATVASLRRIDSPIDVFNIEVENEHVYYVGVDGMLVHNADGAKGYGGKGSDSAADAAKADEQAAVGTNTKRIKRRAESDDEYVDIYRGLNVEHPRFKDATDGIATPGNVDGHADAYRHGLGDTQDSRLTSWSTSEEVAMHYAKSADDRSCSGFGVVLHKRVKRSDLTAGSGPFVQADKEVLLEGVITDADVKWIFRE